MIELLSYRYNLPQCDIDDYPKRAAQLKYLTEREINITASAIAKVFGG